MSADASAATDRLDRTAELVSLWDSPPILGTGYFLMLARVGGPQAYLPVLLSWVLMLLLPTLLLLAQVRMGSIASADMTDLSERKRFLPTALFFVAAAVLISLLLRFPTALQASIAALALWLSASTALSQVWRVSLHVSSAVGLVWLSALLFGAPALALAWLPPAVAWSRLQLHRHDVWQVAGGAILGTVCSLTPALLILHGS